MKRISCLLLTLLLLCSCSHQAQTEQTEIVPPEAPEVVEQLEDKEEPKEVEAEIPYVSPMDFEALQKENPHIYAWLEMSEVGVSEPILQHPEDDSYYLDHSREGNYRQAGELFTEHEYNSIDFEDPLTIIYGHYMKSGAMFGNLQAFYSDSENFEQHKEFTVYLPHKELKYEVFAATRYDNRHILDNYDFRDKTINRLFYESIFAIRDLSANIDRDVEISAEDKVLILSTCLKGDYSQRYLVFAKLVA